MSRVTYLASPHTNYPNGREAAFIDVAKLAARLIRTGLKVYSPIAHTHPIVVHGGLYDMTHAFWLDFDHAMMEACDTLIVARMASWELSEGMAIEIEYFEKVGKPIFDLDPETLVMTRRRKTDDLEVVPQLQSPS